jgi:anti-sigma regulatory factor (Ser/Thr protein kinase)
MNYFDQSSSPRVHQLADQPDGLLTDLCDAQGALTVAECYISAWRRDPLIETTRFSAHQASVARETLLEARSVLDRAQHVIDHVIDMLARQGGGHACSAPMTRRDMARMQTQLPSDMSAPATARQVIREVAPLWQVDDELQDTAQVVISELVGITVGHSGTVARLILERGPQGLRVTIRDASPTRLSRPNEHSANPPRPGSGLGLEILENLTAAWGVDIQPDGKTAWAEITK